MVFNSGTFLLFLVCSLAVYWTLFRVGNARVLQNRFLLLASYVFYGWWDWIFLLLILISTVLDYVVARAIEATELTARRRWLLTFSMVGNLGILGAFKYFDFFATSFVALARTFFPDAFPDGGRSWLLQVVLPVGISFYTFQTMSYTIDVYRRLIPAERNFLDFGLFVCYFPQLVAGPIERAGDLLPQLKGDRRVTEQDLKEGAWLILYGFFLKTFVADHISELVDAVYLPNAGAYRANPALAAGHGGAQVVLASIGFAFQIYGDFAGYSFIALGTSRWLGIRLTVNFDIPQMAQNPAELWRRWHTTLNRWVQDYVYIPLGGSRLGRFHKERNLFLAFFLMGLWHGANWTFAIWGMFHGLWMVLYDLTAGKLPRMPEKTPQVLKVCARLLKMIAVFGIFGMTATLFRAYDIAHSWELWKSLAAFPYDLSNSVRGVASAGSFAEALFKKIAIVLFIDAMSYRAGTPFWILARPLWQRVTVYAVLLYAVLVLGFFGKTVIYFAF